MIRHSHRARSGITLTEILISIMIMGVGMVSLATLFPLGLLRLREAARSSRSAILADAAAADLEGRNLFAKTTFSQGFANLAYFSPWNNASSFTSAPFDPWVQDTGTPSGVLNPTTGVFRGTSQFGAGYFPGPGLPVAYDPLWRYQSGIYIGNSQSPEARFGSGIGLIRPDPGDQGTPSAWGLQRLSNFNPQLIAGFTGSSLYAFPPSVVQDIFVSPEDVVLQSEVGQQSVAAAGGTNASITNANPTVPDLSGADANGQPVTTNDWRFSWMFTGQQADSLNGSIFEGDVVIWENRQFGLSQLAGISGTQTVVDGETVVEGVFGYSTRVGLNGYGVAADRTVLIRWPTSMPDPEIKVGGWIADVTYERNLTTQNTRLVAPDYPFQRCYWYQIVKRTQPAVQAFPNDPVTFRAVTVWIASPLKAQTRLNNSGQPIHANAVLIAPNVVNVFSRVIYTH